MEVAIVGAGGAIGRELVRVLVAAGHRVRAFDPAAAGVARVDRDASAAEWSVLLSGCDAAIVVASRLARRPSTATLYRAPFSAGVGPFLTVAEREALAERAIGSFADGAVDAGIGRVVLVSSATVHGPPAGLPTVEGDPKRPASPGADRVWQIERRTFLRHVDRGLPLAVLRPAAIYGGEVRGPVLSLLSYLALAGATGRRPPTFRRGPVVHLVHVEDVARAAALLLEGPEVPEGAFFVADETPLPLEEVIAAACAGLGLPTPSPRLPYLPRLARLAATAAAALPTRLVAGALRAATTRLSSAGLRRRLVGLRVLPVPTVLELLGRDHYYDASRLAALGFSASHPSAPEGLASFAASLVASGALPPVAIPLRPIRSLAPPEPPAGATISPGPTATALS